MGALGKKLAWALGGLAALALLVVFRQVVGRLLLLLLLSATLAYLLTPLASRLPFSKGLSAGLSFLLAALVLAALVYLGVPALIRQLVGLKDSLPAVLQSGANLLQRLKTALSGLGVTEQSMQGLETQVAQLLGQGAQWAAGLLVSAGNAVASSWYLLLSPVLAFYMVRDKDALFDTVQRLLPRRWRKRASALGLRIRREIGDYVRSQLTVSLITGSLTALGLLLIGLPSWLVMGLLMVLFNLIPYFGPLLGMVPILVFSIPSGPTAALLGALVALAAQQVESLVVAPRIIGQAAQLHPGLVMLSLTVGGWVFGFAGLFFSIPAVLSIRALLETLRDARMQA